MLVHVAIAVNLSSADLLPQVNHVPAMMQYVWDEGGIPYGLTVLKVTEK
jgi:hypothetical protein